MRRWRSRLIAHYESSTGVWLATWKWGRGPATIARAVISAVAVPLLVLVEAKLPTLPAPAAPARMVRRLIRE